jgi:hypothetical protein
MRFAVRAASVKRNLVELDSKAARRKTPQVSGATLHVEDAAARRALKVVVMPGWRRLVPRRVARNSDRFDCPVGVQQLEIAIDGGEPESRNGAAGGIENLLRR